MEEGYQRFLSGRNDRNFLAKGVLYRRENIQRQVESLNYRGMETSHCPRPFWHLCTTSSQGPVQASRPRGSASFVLRRAEFALNEKITGPFSSNNSFPSFPLQCIVYNLFIPGCTYRVHLLHHYFIISSCFKIAWATEKQRWWTGKTAGLLLDEDCG